MLHPASEERIDLPAERGDTRDRVEVRPGVRYISLEAETEHLAHLVGIGFEKTEE